MRCNLLLRRAIAAAIGLALVTSGFALSAAKASTTGTFGDSTGYSPGGGFVWESTADRNADLDSVVSSGGSWIRIDLSWSQVEGTKGTYGWSPFDNAVNAATARGIRVLLILDYAPTWATGCSGTDKCMPTTANVPAYGAFAGAAAAHFRGRAAAYEIWNEPNVKWASGTPDPAGYAAIARAAYPQIKAGDPAATVVVGATSPASTANGEYSPLDWAKALWANGINGAFDAWSAHPYTYPALPAQTGTESWSAWWAMVNTHSYLASVGRDVPMWMTEFGTPTRGLGYADTYERDAIISAVTTAATYSWAGPLFLYAIRDDSTANTIGNSFGLLNFDHTPKTAWQPVSDKLHAARSGATTTTTVAPTTTTVAPTTTTTVAPTTTTVAPTTTTVAPTTTTFQQQAVGYDPTTDARVLALSTTEAAYEARSGDVIRAYRSILGR
ncbi:MAG: polysaccharide biosynthesis protein PslG, partial [Acidimicrobiaceae bacterium]